MKFYQLLICSLVFVLIGSQFSVEISSYRVHLLISVVLVSILSIGQFVYTFGRQYKLVKVSPLVTGSAASSDVDKLASYYCQNTAAPVPTLNPFNNDLKTATSINCLPPTGGESIEEQAQSLAQKKPKSEEDNSASNLGPSDKVNLPPLPESI